MTRKLTTLLLLLCMVLGGLQTQAQGWEKKYSPDAVMAIDMIYPTPGGSYLVTGWNISPPVPFQRVMKMDGNGEVMWKSDIDSIDNPGAANVTQDGGIIMLAFGPSISGTGSHFTNVVRVDSNGQKLWLKTLRPTNATTSTSGNVGVDTTDDGGFVAFYSCYDSVALKYYLYVDRLDGSGNTLWENHYYPSDTTAISYDIMNSKDGGFIITAGSNSTSSLYLFKIDGSGNFLWEYQPGIAQHWISACIKKDGNIYVLGTNFGGGNNAISTLNQAGQLLWTQAYNLPGGSDWGWYGNVIEKSSNRLALLVSGYDTVMVLNTPTRALANKLAIVDTMGNILYYKDIPRSNLGSNVSMLQTGNNNCFERTLDNGYITGGWLQYDVDNNSAFLIKMDSNGIIYPTTLSGYVYADMNSNCSKDSGEIFMSPVNVTFANSTDTFTVVTDASGYYSLGLDTGSYSIVVSPPSPYWQPSACNANTVNLPQGIDSSLSFSLTPIINSPYILINGYLGPQVAWCRPAVYTAEYCNYGTAPFTGSIVVTIDSMLQVDSASIPWVLQNGNQYTFNVDTLGVMDCTTLKMYTTVHCYADLIGRTATIVAQAYQDTILVSSPNWDHSNVQMAVHFHPSGDSITFTGTNNGTGSMGSPQNLIVIEDNVILMHVPQQLLSGGQFTQTVPANGSTWRATMQQTTGNPYATFTTAAIEAAGTNAQGGISTGYITQFPYNGYTSYQYTTCAEIKSSYDPNQKAVTPKGSGVNALVDTNTYLEYVIDFQNTGNASATTVVVIDTLPPYVNPATIRLEVSSSTCTMQLSGKNTVIFTFTNINLPDSGSNPSGSIGFVKFGISQKSNNANGTIIDNKAGIYFDYNPGVITNTARVRIGQVLLTDVQSVYQQKQLLINAYPNPFSSITTIKITGEIFNDLQLNVYDVNGRLVKQERTQNTNQFILNRNGLETGSYLFEITSNEQPVGRGKIVAQ